MEVSGKFQALLTLPPVSIGWVARWVLVGLDMMAKKEFPAPAGNQIPILQSVGIAQRYSAGLRTGCLGFECR
jgi:hypothetical protein